MYIHYIRQRPFVAALAHHHTAVSSTNHALAPDIIPLQSRTGRQVRRKTLTIFNLNNYLALGN